MTGMKLSRDISAAAVTDICVGALRKFAGRKLHDSK
jgi:hypothetical protein